jgi:hypothetical protein
MKLGVFICYKRKDVPGFAGRLYDHVLDSFPGQVFMDVENISPGQNFISTIDHVLSECAVVVALIGPTWASLLVKGQNNEDPDYVVLELRKAIERGLPIIPVLVDGATIPSKAELPDGLATLRFHHALQARTDAFMRDIAPIFKALYQVLGIRPPSNFEQFVARLPGAKTIDEKARKYNAILCLWAGFVACIGTLHPRSHLESLVLAFIAIWTGFVGKNSRTHGRIALLGMVLAFLAVMGVTVLQIYFPRWTLF